jgi:hypothetical protein
MCGVFDETGLMEILLDDKEGERVFASLGLMLVVYGVPFLVALGVWKRLSRKKPPEMLWYQFDK